MSIIPIIAMSIIRVKYLNIILLYYLNMSFFNAFTFACDNGDTIMIERLLQNNEFKTNINSCVNYVINNNYCDILTQIINSTRDHNLIISSFNKGVINRIIINDNIILYKKLNEYNLININYALIKMICRYDSINIFKMVIDTTEVLKLYNYYIDSIEHQSFKISKYIINNLNFIIYDDYLLMKSAEFYFPHLKELIKTYIHNNRPIMNVLTYLIQYGHYELFKEMLEEYPVLVSKIFLINFNQALIYINHMTVINIIEEHNSLYDTIFSQFNSQTLFYNLINYTQSDIIIRYILKNELISLNVFKNTSTKNTELFQNILKYEKVWIIQMFYDFNMKINKKYWNTVFPLLIKMDCIDLIINLVNNSILDKLYKSTINNSILISIDNNNLEMLRILINIKKYKPEFYIYKDMCNIYKTIIHVDDFNRHEYFTPLEYAIIKKNEFQVDEDIIFYLFNLTNIKRTPKSIQLLSNHYENLTSMVDKLIKNPQLHISINKWGSLIIKSTIEYLEKNPLQCTENIKRIINKIKNNIIDTRQLTNKLTDGMCSICHSEDINEQILFNDLGVKCNQCTKSFHLCCMIKWFNYKEDLLMGTCPQCRTEIDLIKEPVI